MLGHDPLGYRALGELEPLAAAVVPVVETETVAGKLRLNEAATETALDPGFTISPGNRLSLRGQLTQPITVLRYSRGSSQSAGNLLQENGDELLLETGDGIALEFEETVTGIGKLTLADAISETALDPGFTTAPSTRLALKSQITQPLTVLYREQEVAPEAPLQSGVILLETGDTLLLETGDEILLG